MALMTGFADGQGTPDKHIRPSAATGLQATGDYPGMDTNVSGQIPDTSSGMADGEAKSIYGTPEGGATRNQRVQSVGAVSEAHSTGDGSSASVHQAFIDETSFHGWTDC